MAGWRDNLRTASFRGVEFFVRGHSATGGRHGVTHEFAGRDLPYREDLGRMARGWTIRAYVLGDDYFEKRDALLAPKVGLGMLLTLGIQFLVAGVAVLVSILVGDTGHSFTRTGTGLAIGGGLNLVVPGILYWKFIRPRSEPDILQKALGINAVIFGVFSGLWITATVMNILNGAPVATSLWLSSLYTALLVVSSLLSLIPLVKSIDDERKAESSPEYTSYEDKDRPT